MAKKRRVLIVDDEFRIGILIQKLTHWDELGMECLAVLDNGEAALQAIKESKPDIVITDVRMPKINGLDLIQMVRAQKMNTQFIVVSGYKEFEYARRAMAYGVKSYILKPVNENDLNEALTKLRERLDIEAQEQFNQEELKKKVDESNKIIKRDFLRNIIDQKEEENLSGSSVPMTGELFRGIDIKLDYADLDRMDTKQESIVIAKVQELVETLLAGDLKELLICPKESLHIYCLLNYDGSDSRNIIKKIGALLIQIKEYLLGFEIYEVTIGVGGERDSFGDVRFSILEAYQAVCNRMRLGTGRLIYGSTLPANDREEIMLRLAESRERIRESIEHCSREELNNCISQIFAESPAGETKDCTGYYAGCEDFLDYFFQILDQEDLSGYLKKIKSCYQHCYKVSQLQRLLRKNLGECVDSLRVLEENKNSKPVRLAKQYVEEHYREKILLEDIAAVVDLNPVYFSVVFKKETDMNFSAYLIQVRMEKAKKMLTAGNDTIAAIGDAVGYSDQKYFSQLFKKMVGIKPIVYRRLYS